MRVGKILQNALKKSENFDKEGSALMIKKFTSGNPIDTQAVVEKYQQSRAVAAEFFKAVMVVFHHFGFLERALEVAEVGRIKKCFHM